LAVIFSLDPASLPHAYARRHRRERNWKFRAATKSCSWRRTRTRALTATSRACSGSTTELNLFAVRWVEADRVTDNLDSIARCDSQW